jgi:UPF0148 protein
MREKDVAKMAEMLLAGGKMLSLHCAACKSPLFEYEGKVICPVCGEKAKAAKPEAKPEERPGLERILREKLDQLAARLEKETDLRATSELLELMKSILEVLGRLKSR